MSINSVLIFEKSKIKSPYLQGKSFNVSDAQLCENLTIALKNISDNKLDAAYVYFYQGIERYLQKIVSKLLSYNTIMEEFLDNLEVIHNLIHEVLARDDRAVNQFVKALLPVNQLLIKTYHRLQKDQKLNYEHKAKIISSILNNGLFITRLDFNNEDMEIFCEELLYYYNDIPENLREECEPIKAEILMRLADIAFSDKKYQQARDYIKTAGTSRYAVYSMLYKLAMHFENVKDYMQAYACATEALIALSNTPRKFIVNKMLRQHPGELRLDYVDAYVKFAQSNYNEAITFEPRLKIIRQKCFTSHKEILSAYLKDNKREFSISIINNNLEIRTEIFGYEDALNRILKSETELCVLNSSQHGIIITKFDSLSLAALKRIVEFIQIKENTLKKLKERQSPASNLSVTPVIAHNSEIKEINDRISELAITSAYRPSLAVSTSTVDQKNIKQEAAQLIQRQENKKEKKKEKNKETPSRANTHPDSVVDSIIDSDAKFLGFSTAFGNGKFSLCRKHIQSRNIYVVHGEKFTGDVPTGKNLTQYEARFDNAVIVPKRGASGFKWMKNPAGVEPAQYLVGKVTTQQVRLQPTFYQVNAKGDVAFFYGEFVNTKKGNWKNDFAKKGVPIPKIS